MGGGIAHRTKAALGICCCHVLSRRLFVILRLVFLPRLTHLGEGLHKSFLGFGAQRDSSCFQDPKALIYLKHSLAGFLQIIGVGTWCCNPFCKSSTLAF